MRCCIFCCCTSCAWSFCASAIARIRCWASRLVLCWWVPMSARCWRSWSASARFCWRSASCCSATPDDISALCCCSRSRARSRCCSAYWPSSCLRTAFCSLRILSWMIWSARRRVSSIFFSVFRSSCSSRPSRLRSSSTSCSDRCRALRTLSMCEPVYGPRGERAATLRGEAAEAVIIVDERDVDAARRIAEPRCRASCGGAQQLEDRASNNGAARGSRVRRAPRGCRGDR